MYELIQAGERTYYINSPTKVGIYQCSADEVYLIDSGNDKDAGRRIRKILAEKGWKLKGIINTHSHSDHIGGNQYLQRQTGCRIYGKGIERAFTQQPILEPACLYGGFPPGDLRHKFLLAAESVVQDINEADFPPELTVLDLPGHAFDMIGIRTPDDVVFLADCLSSQATLEKYQITFIYDVKAYLQTLELVASLKGTLFIPAHTEALTDMTELAAVNRQKVLEIRNKLMEVCHEPIAFEDLLQVLFTDYGLKMNFDQYVLVGSTVKSYLAWLRDEGILDIVFQDNKLLWKNIG